MIMYAYFITADNYVLSTEEHFILASKGEIAPPLGKFLCSSPGPSYTYVDP